MLSRRQFYRRLAGATVAGIAGISSARSSSAAETESKKYPPGKFFDIHTHLGQAANHTPALSAEELLRDGVASLDLGHELPFSPFGEIDLIRAEFCAASNVEAAVVAILHAAPFEAHFEVGVLAVGRKMRRAAAAQLNHAVGDFPVRSFFNLRLFADESPAGEVGAVEERSEALLLLFGRQQVGASDVGDEQETETGNDESTKEAGHA